MGYNNRYKRRKSVTLSSTVGDIGAIANWFGPKGAFITGAAGFTIFYFCIPTLLHVWADQNKASMSGPLAPIMANLLDSIFMRRFIGPSEWAGIAMLCLGSVISLWKLIANSEMSSVQQREVTFWSKLVARFFD